MRNDGTTSGKLGEAAVKKRPLASHVNSTAQTQPSQIAAVRRSSWRGKSYRCPTGGASIWRSRHRIPAVRHIPAFERSVIEQVDQRIALGKAVVLAAPP